MSVLATQEVLELAAAANLHPLRWTVYFANLLLLASSWLYVGERHRLMEAERWSALVIAGLLIFLGVMCRYREPGGNTANLVAGVFAVFYVGLMLSFAVRLRMEWGVGALASWVIVVKMGDTGAYAVGRLIGRHKMAPRISPGKTMEGTVGAVAFSCLGSWLVFKWLIPSSLVMSTEAWPRWVEPGTTHFAGVPWWGWVTFGLLVGAAGILGDLAESLLKRDVGRKDSSAWMPGFGGVLDILDSLLLSAPVAWACWAFGLVSSW